MPKLIGVKYVVFILLLMRVGLATLFISTGWSKIYKVEEHIAIVKDYRILPSQMVQLGARFEMFIEIVVGCLLLVGVFQQWTLVAAILLLVIYCFAISINLLRGRKEISCGCGGLAGHHSLSWLLVLRNVVLICLCVWLIGSNPMAGSLDGVFKGYSWTQTFPMGVFDGAFLFWSGILILFITVKFRELYQHMNKLLGN